MCKGVVREEDLKFPFCNLEPAVPPSAPLLPGATRRFWGRGRRLTYDWLWRPRASRLLGRGRGGAGSEAPRLFSCRLGIRELSRQEPVGGREP